MSRVGFALLEVLLVIAILAILAALLFPTLSEVGNRARATQCLSQLRQIAVAQRLYADDADGGLPHWYEVAPEEPDGVRYWPELFRPYLKSAALSHCPSFSWATEEPSVGEKLADYALLTWGPGGHGTSGDPYWRWAGPPMPLAEVARPSETFNLADGVTMVGFTRAFSIRHRLGFNVGCLDGHARWMTRPKAFQVEREPSGVWRYRFISADRE